MLQVKARSAGQAAAADQLLNMTNPIRIGRSQNASDGSTQLSSSPNSDTSSIIVA